MSIRTLKLFLLFTLLLTSCSPSRAYREQPQKGRDDRELAYALELSRRAKIVIDPGHGGKDLGALSVKDPKYQEKTLNLTTAIWLKTFLQQMGYQTIMTRADDFFVPLDLRAAFANSNQAKLFVSVHYNSAPNKKAEGVEVYYYDAETDKERTEQSKKLAKTVLDQIVANTKCKSRGVKHGNLAVIRETKMPAILIEGGFVTNETELNKLQDPNYQKTLAGSIALGIRSFLKPKKRS
ncbi:MAG: N-acetylmuramoyl-L-alanine amidase [Waddliaceae bacterium]